MTLFLVKINDKINQLNNDNNFKNDGDNKEGEIMHEINNNNNDGYTEEGDNWWWFATISNDSRRAAATTRTNIMPLHNRQSSVSHHSLNSIIEHPENNKDKLKNRRASNAIGMGQDYSNDGSHDELGRQR